MLFKSKSILYETMKRFALLANTKRTDLLNGDSKIIPMIPEMKLNDYFEQFKLILDVRSPMEFKDDHIPGALNIPILNDMERANVGEVYSKTNPLSARLLGSSLIMNNLSKYLQPGELLFEALNLKIKNEDDKILVYCWRGGQRSRSVALVLSEIAINRQPICVLNGGYKAYRRQIIDSFNLFSEHITFVGICGLTGSGKTKILNCLESLGETTLDLEYLAEHKGSMFGSYLCNVNIEKGVDFCQLSQKMFESRLYQSLIKILLQPISKGSKRRTHNNKLIVWVECESRNIGNVQIPEGIWNLIQESKRIIIEASKEERIKHIITDYNYWTNDSYICTTQIIIDWFAKHVSKSLVNHWKSLVEKRNFIDLVDSLLTEHYDPLYKRNRQKFMKCDDTTRVVKFPVDSLNIQYIESVVCPRIIETSEKMFNSVLNK